MYYSFLTLPQPMDEDSYDMALNIGQDYVIKQSYIL